MRSRGHSVGILDANAEGLDLDQALDRIAAANPRLVCFVVYGNNVNAGTVGMSGAVALANRLKHAIPEQAIAFLGSYVQALPKKALEDEASIDLAFTNEGVYALDHVLRCNDFSSGSLAGVRGIVWRNDDGTVVINPAEEVVPTAATSPSDP